MTPEGTPLPAAEPRDYREDYWDYRDAQEASGPKTIMSRAITLSDTVQVLLVLNTATGDIVLHEYRRASPASPEFVTAHPVIFPK